MISILRKASESWLARGFFFLMALAFVGWGISGDLFRLMGPPSWIAKVGGQPIEIAAFQQEFQQALGRISAKLPSGQQPTALMRLQTGQQTLETMIDREAMAQELHRLRVVTPDGALAAAVRAMAAFQDNKGQFSKAVFQNKLANAGLNEATFLNDMRADIAQQQLMNTLLTAAYAPTTETNPLFEAEFERRAADTALFPFAAAPAPAEPTEADIHRYYDNHPFDYKTPEYRRIRAIELSPESLASDVKISEKALRAQYEAHKADYVKPEKRSAEVISAPDEAKAKALAAQWSGGAKWDAMRKAATAAGASAISQTDALKVEFADPDLAKAVFAAAPDTVSAPIKGQLGWFVVKVTKVTPGAVTSFTEAEPKLRSEALASKAADLMYDKANKIDNLLGNGTNIADLPANLGVIGITGTLDAHGDTPAGTAAPIPGPAELRKAIVTAAFQAHRGDMPELTEVQTPSTGGSAYYALSVESITPPGEKPFDQVKQQVIADWKAAQRRRFQNQAATAMMLAVQKGENFSDAATKAGVTPSMTPRVTRNAFNAQMPPELQRVLFGLKLNEATMVETPNGFLVAQLAEITKADPVKDKLDYDRTRQAVAKSVSDDIGTIFINAIRQKSHPDINQKTFDSIVQTH